MVGFGKPPSYRYPSAQFSGLLVLMARLNLLWLPFFIVLLGGCTAAKVAGKVVAAPVKVAWKGGKMAGKGIWYTGKGTYYVTKYGGQGLILVGSVPVQITQAALETTSDVLAVTAQAIDVTGALITITLTVSSSELQRELENLELTLRAFHAARDIVAVTVDVIDALRPS